MNLPRMIVGTWRLPSAFVEGAEEFMHIGEDGRIVHFVYQDASGTRALPMMLWAKLLEQDRYEIRIRPAQEAWTVRLIPTDEGMTIDRNEMQFYLVAAEDSEVAGWYAQKLERALALMSECEAGSPPATSP